MKIESGLKRKIQNTKFSRKLFAAFFLTSSITLIPLGIYSYYQAHNNLLDKQKQSVKEQKMCIRDRPNTWEHKKRATEFELPDYYRGFVRALRMDELIEKHCEIMSRYDPAHEVEPVSYTHLYAIKTVRIRFRPPPTMTRRTDTPKAVKNPLSFSSIL